MLKPVEPTPPEQASQAVAEANRLLAEKHPEEAARVLVETLAA